MHAPKLPHLSLDLDTEISKFVRRTKPAKSRVPISLDQPWLEANKQIFVFKCASISYQAMSWVEFIWR